MAVRSIIIGMGNPLLMDDGVGIQVVRELGSALGERDDVEFCELGTGGIRLMEVMAGFDRAWIVDAMVTGNAPPGTIRPFALSEFVTTKNTYSTHDTDLATALEMGRMAGIKLPEEIRIWGVEAKETDLFGEVLTEPVAAAVPEVVKTILGELESFLMLSKQPRLSKSCQIVAP